jgi:hypothetical protein
LLQLTGLMSARAEARCIISMRGGSRRAAAKLQV